MKKLIINILMIQLILAGVLSACAPANCNLQLLAGGSQYCEESISK